MPRWWSARCGGLHARAACTRNSARASAASAHTGSRHTPLWHTLFLVMLLRRITLHRMPRCLRKQETDPCTLIPARTCRGRSCCVWACRHPRNSRSACASTQLAFPLVPYSACSLSRSRAVPPIPCRPDRRRAATGATRERALVNALARMHAPTRRPALTNAHASALAVGSARLVRVRCVHLTSRMGTCCSFRASCMACASTSTRTLHMHVQWVHAMHAHGGVELHLTTRAHHPRSRSTCARPYMCTATLVGASWRTSV